jgi:hypothetical protein
VPSAVSPEQASRILSDLSDRLEASDELPEAYARALLDQAQRKASLKPTPQARMAAQGMGVRGGTILSLSGGAPGAVAVGSEFGSTIYRQFGPRNTRGYWLLPSAENPDPGTIAAGDEAVEDVVRAAIRRA